MALCFVVNKDLTVPFSDVARQLRDRGERIVWLSPSTRWSRWLMAEGWPKGDILSLPVHADEWRNVPIDESLKSLADVESEPPGTIGNVIQMCRYLRRSPPAFSYAYLSVVQRYVAPFLRNRNVEIVFGEATWGFELLTWLVCRKNCIPMLLPAPTRIPGDRFYFADAMTAGLFPFAEVMAADHDWAQQFLETWQRRPTPPTYMAEHFRGYKPFHARWLIELAIGVLRPALDRDDATLWPLRARIRDRIVRYANALAFRCLNPCRVAPDGERYVLYPLHHQPEASVDVYGSLNSNQVALIQTLSKLLPATHKLWIKEHKGAIGDRSIGWYRRIAALPNVRLIDAFQDIYGLIRNADLVVTISGTAAYEAALMGIPALGLAPVFFSSLLSNAPTARSHPLEWRLPEILSTSKTQEAVSCMQRKAIDFLAHLHANSFAGNPIVLQATASQRSAPGYLQSEGEAFSKFLRAFRERRTEATTRLQCKTTG